jgi:hypothetical protein
MIQIQAQQEIGRAMNAVQEYLIRKLLLPKVYLDVLWSGAPVQVLAVDRAGSGDVHAVWTMYLTPGIETGIASAAMGLYLPRAVEEMKLWPAVEEIKSRPTHFRYVAIVSDDPAMRGLILSQETVSKALAEDGVGRVGILIVDMTDVQPSVRVILKPERFRSSKEIVELADRYVAEHPANWEIRE